MDIGQLVDMQGIRKPQVAQLIVSSFIQACDAIEMLILSLIGPILKCEWLIGSFKISLLTWGVFFGMFFGAPTIGTLSDYYGRKTMAYYSSLLVAFFSVLSVFSPSYYWLLLFRTLLGFAVGGVLASNSSLIVEITPSWFRSNAVILNCSVWPLGGLYVALTSYLLVDTYGWRVFLFVCALMPCFIVFTYHIMIESPRFLLVSGQYEKLKNYFQPIMSSIDQAQFEKNLDLGASRLQKPRENVLLFLKDPTFFRNSIFLFLMWSMCGFLYYGLVLTIPNLIHKREKCTITPFMSLLNGNSSILSVENLNENRLVVDTSCCREISKDVYVSIMLSVIGEFVALPIQLTLIRLVNRRTCFVILGSVFTSMYLALLFVCNRPIMNVFFFISRICCFSYYNMAYLYTMEAYPTAVRSRIIGICSSFSRVGAMFTPFVAQNILMDFSDYLAICIYIMGGLVAVICPLLLTIETKNKKLRDSISDFPKSEDKDN